MEFVMDNMKIEDFDEMIKIYEKHKKKPNFII